MKLLRIIFCLYLALLLASCSGGGSADSSGEDTQTQNILVTGKFIDSAVSGITYICSSNSSENKLTNSLGEYTCSEGDSVTFSLGNVIFGTIEVKANKVVTPYTLFPSNKTAAINIGRLLQTIDSDGDPDNGITIEIEDAKKLVDNIDFTNDDFVAITQTRLGKTLISVALAEEHFLENIGNFSSIGLPLKLNNIITNDIDKTIIIYFNKKLDYSTIKKENISISKDGAIDFEIAFANNYRIDLAATKASDAFVLILDEDIDYDSSYFLLIKDSIKDLEGNSANFFRSYTLEEEINFTYSTPTFTANFDNDARLDFSNPLQVTFSSSLKSLENISENIYVTNLTTNEKVLISHPDISNNLIIQMDEIFYTDTSSKYRLTIKNFTSSDNIVMDEFNIDFELGIIYNEKFYKTVEAGTNIWLDRNIGATQRCNEDGLNTECFGGYFQWGRLADGHEFNNSITNKIKKTVITLEETNTEFISEWDWLEDGIDDDFSLRKAKWDSLTENSVCPIGFKVPTKANLTDSLSGEESMRFGLSDSKAYHGRFNNDLRPYFWINEPGMSFTIKDDESPYSYGGASSKGLPIRCIKGE